MYEEFEEEFEWEGAEGEAEEELEEELRRRGGAPGRRPGGLHRARGVARPWGPSSRAASHVKPSRWRKGVGRPPTAGGARGGRRPRRRPWVFTWGVPPPWWTAAPAAPEPPEQPEPPQDGPEPPQDGPEPPQDGPEAAPAAVEAAVPTSVDGPPGTAGAPGDAAPEASPDDAAPQELGAAGTPAAKEGAPSEEHVAGELLPWVRRAITGELEAERSVPGTTVTWLPPVIVHGHPFVAPVGLSGGGIYVVMGPGGSRPMYVGEAANLARRWSGRLLSAHQLGLTAPDGRLPHPLTVHFGKLPPKQAAVDAIRKAVEHAVIRTLILGGVAPTGTLRNRRSFLQLKVKGRIAIQHVLPPPLLPTKAVPGLVGDRLSLADGSRFELDPT